jgi:hypothetical protein
MKVNRAPQVICRGRRKCDAKPAFRGPESELRAARGALFSELRIRNTEKLIILGRLRVEKLENLARAFGADAGNLAEVGDRRSLDLLQGSEMVQQGTFA